MIGHKGMNGGRNYGYFKKHYVDNYTKLMGGGHHSFNHEVAHRIFHDATPEEHKRDLHLLKRGHRD